MSRKLEEEPVAGAPMWMVSFGDLMSLLLCFFVLLYSFSEERRLGFISDGIVAFRRALVSHGLPGVLPADRTPLDLGADKVLYKPPRSISARQLTDADGNIDAGNREALREVLLIALQAPATIELPVPIVFSPGTAALTEAHRSALREIAPRLAVGGFGIRVDGYAWKEGVAADQEWGLACERAANVAAALVEIGGIDPGRVEPIGFGPPSGGPETVSVRQQRWGRRIVMLTLVRS
jgi:chemotaxis protein MotB